MRNATGILRIRSYLDGRWMDPDAGARAIESALTGDVIGLAGRTEIYVPAMLRYARDIGGPNLRKLGFHDRARMLKSLALYLKQHREILCDLSFDTGATRADQSIDIDGGIGTMLVYASKARREMPDGHILLDGGLEQLSRRGSFLGQHIATPLTGVALHINAFNFPVWGMLEKLAPTWLAGMPAIVKPATATCQVSEACVRLMLQSGLLPEGVLQLVIGGIGDTLDHLGGQDVVTFTGSRETAATLRSRPGLLRNATRFTVEQDSLNGALLAPDATPGTKEFDLFTAEVAREMTSKAGQKCTAIRRILVPDATVGDVIGTLRQRLATIRIGDPRNDNIDMDALVSTAQKSDVLIKTMRIGEEATRVIGDPKAFNVIGGDPTRGAFLPPMLFYCPEPDSARLVHETEAFGPVATILGYKDLDHAIHLLNCGGGSLVASVFTNDPVSARTVALGVAATHGRLYFNNRTSAEEATGHGAPLPHMVHGGPGGGEELGGIRAVLHYMQRTAVQGSPDILAGVSSKWVPGASTRTDKPHPFTRPYASLDLGDSLKAGPRVITTEDIETFAHFTGDTFYAHMDDAAARANPFFPGRVAHGYLLLSFAAGLFVHPDPGPVLANTGLDTLRFLTPVEPGDALSVQLTVKAKTPRSDSYGKVRWHVVLSNQRAETVAEYDLLTMNAF